MTSLKKPIRVLIADDHDIVRRGVRDILLDEYGQVEFGEARTTQEAIQLLTLADWDVVLLDINMPGRGGLEVLEELRCLRPNTPVLVVSAYPEEEFAIRSFKLGASGYLTKGSAADELLTAVRKILDGGKYVTATMAEKLVTTMGRPKSRMSHEALSKREMQVLQLIARGKSIKEAAAALCLSEKTIGTYRGRLAVKLGLTSNVEITRYALLNKLVE